MLAEGVKVGIGAVPGLKDASGFIKDALNAQFDGQLNRIDAQPSPTAPETAAKWLDAAAAEQEIHRTYVVGSALADAGVLPEPTDPKRRVMAPMVGDEGHLRPYEDLVHEGQQARLRSAVEAGPDLLYRAWTSILGLSDNTFRNYLPGGGYVPATVLAQLTVEERMEMQYGPGWRSVPPGASR